MGVNSLPKTVTRQRRDCDLNSGFSAPESSTLTTRLPSQPVDCGVEVCMGMGKTGIPWVPWDSHGNGFKISHGMGMEIKCMGMGVKTWELSPATVNSLLFLHSNME